MADKRFSTYMIDFQTFEDPLENAPLSDDEQSLFDAIKADVAYRATKDSNSTLSDNALIRFVRGYHYEIDRYEQTLKYVRAHIKSRIAKQLDSILETEPSKLVEYRKVFKEIIHRQDRQGHLFKIIPLRECQLKKVKTLTAEELAQARYYDMENTIKQLEEYSSKGRVRLYKVLTIIDFKDIGLMSGLPDLVTLVKSLTKTFETEYPEMCFKILLINSSWIMRNVISMMMLGAHERTRTKIEVINATGKELTNKLREYILLKNIPKVYGGVCECDECKSL